jgi:tRNA A-37 threonylcarbamoyl transferase component Bud32
LTPKPIQFRSVSLKNASPIMVEAVVRVLPDRREVIRGTWDDQVVFAKIFFGKDAKKYSERDLAGVRLLSTANITSPEFLYQGALEDEPGDVLIYKAVEPSHNVESLWAELSEGSSRFELAKKLVLAVAEHHNAGLIQTDLYLKNFLLSEDVIFTLDGDGIRKYLPLTPKLAVANLCVLLSKFDVLDLEIWMPDLIAVYQEKCNLPVDLRLNRIKQKVHLYRKRVANGYADKKVFRTCTDVKVTLGKNFSAVSSKFSHLNLSQDVSRYDDLIGGQDLLKVGNTCTVGLVKFDETQVVIKRYNIKNIWHFFNRMWRPSRAAVSWANAHRLIILGLATANPVALLEQRTIGLRGKAYFLSEYVDAPDLNTFFSQVTDDAQRSALINTMVELLYRLFLLRVSHGDMKATNIKVFELKPLLIDLDSMKQHDFAFFALKAHVKDLRRFMQNWKEDTSLYNAFVDSFKSIYIDQTALVKANIIN